MTDSSSDPTRRQLMRVYKYFKPMPWGSFLLVGLGILLFQGDAEWVGGAIVLVGGALAGAWLERAPEEEVDKLQEQRLECLWSSALAACALSQEDQIRMPLMVSGPRIWNRGGAELLGKKGTDGVVRYTLLHVAVIHFTQHFLSVYECAIDLFSPQPLNEATTEFYYPDIVSVSTRAPSDRIQLMDVPKHLRSVLSGEKPQKDMLTLTEGKEFEITSKAGTSVKLFLPKTLSAGEDDGQNAVNAVRQMLRDKKTA